MRKTIAMRIGILVAIFASSAYLTISLLHVMLPRDPAIPQLTISESPIPKKVVASETTTYTPPVRLEIAKLSVNAAVTAVGLTQDNAMDIPEDMAKTAWYKLGPKPGEKGSAVIAGHYGVANGQSAIFSYLHTLQPGDKITVYDEKNNALVFIVREMRRYNLDADATEVFKSVDDKAHLNLITCGGSWDYFRQTYVDRLVVFSDIEI